MILDFANQKKQKGSERQDRSAGSGRSYLTRILIGGAGGCALIGILVWAVFSWLPSPAGDLPYGVLLFEEMSQEKTRSTVSLLWVQPERAKGTIVRLPADMEYSSRTYGYFPISSALRAYTVSTASASTFAADVSLFFRLPMVGFLAGEGNAGDSGVKLATFVFRACRSAAHSVTMRDCLALLRTTLSPTFSLRTVALPDAVFSPAKTEATRSLNRERYREWLQKNIAGQEEIHRQFTVAVLNTTNRSGIARNAAEILGDFGFRIIRADQGTDPRQQGVVYINDSVAYSLRVKLFLTQILHVPIVVNAQETQKERSDIVYRIGEDEADFFSP